MNVGDTIVLLLIWLVNGLLVVAFWLADHVFPFAIAPAFYLLLLPAKRQQRPYAIGAGVLGLLAAVISDQPLPLILLLMAWVGVGGVALDKFSPDTLRWRVIGTLGLYALGILGWSAYSAYLDTLSAAQYGSLVASDEAASTIAQGRSFLDTIAVWGLWIIVPLGYFVLLLQGLLVHPPMPATPQQVITTVRAREEGGGGEEQGGQRTFPAWWPFGGSE